MGKGRKLRTKKSLGPLGRWLIKNKISITHFATHANLAYRTVWLAAHGYKVEYETAEKVMVSVKRLQPKSRDATMKSGTHDVTIKKLCSGKPRAEFMPTMG